MTGILIHFVEHRSKVIQQTWLSQEGVTETFQRISQKAAQAPPPLLATCELVLESGASSRSSPPFVKEWELVTDRSSLARPWKRMQVACFFASFLKLNATHFPDPADVFSTADTVLNAFSISNNPRAVLLKGLIQILRAEGLPVLEDWAPQQPPGTQSLARTLISHPVASESVQGLSSPAVEQAFRSFEHWMRQSTDLEIPSQ